MHSTEAFIKKTAAIAVFIVVAILVISSSAQITKSGDLTASASPAASQNSTFIAGWTGTSIDTLNPFVTYSHLSRWVDMNVYLPLVHFDTINNTVQPALASSWSVNYTNHTAIFHINPNAVWSDGQPVTAQDVVYSYNISKQSYSFLSTFVAAVSNVTALSNSEVMISFTGTLWLMWAASVWVVPYHIWKNVNPQTFPAYSTNSSTYFVGDGPYLLTKYVPNSYAEVQKNPKWFIAGETPKISNVIFQEFSTTSSAITALQSGEIQSLNYLLPANAAQFDNNSAFVVSKSPAAEYMYLSIDVQNGSQGNPTLRNLTVRQAIAHAVNYTYLAKTVYHGFAFPIASVLAPTNEYYDKNLTPYSYNVKLANQMLNASGFKMGSNGYRVSPNGTALKYTLLVNSADTLATSMAGIIADNLTAIGIHASVLSETTGSMASTIWRANGTLGQDMDLWDWFDKTPFAPQLLTSFLSSEVATGVSDSGFNNSAYDNMWTQLLDSNSPSQTLNLSYQMQVMLHNQLPYIPLVALYSINVWSSSYKNINSSFFGGPFGGLDYLTFITATPANGTASPSHNPYLIYEIVVPVIVIIAAVGAVMARRRKE